jgi:hypothetical protein
MRRLPAALALWAACAAAASADDAAEEWAASKGSAAEIQLHRQLKAAVRTIPGTDTQFFVGGYLQLDAIAQQKRQDGAEQNTFLVSSAPFGPTDRDSRLSARQSQFNWLSKTPTAAGEVWTRLEANLFPIDGATRLEVNQAFVRVGESLIAGKTYSTFMDDGALPTTLDYNGPSGVTFMRQALVRGSYGFGSGWTVEGSIEDPQADFSATGQILGLHVGARRPDLAARVRYEGERGHVQLAGLSRALHANATSRLGSSDRDVDGSGIALSGSLPGFGDDTILLQAAAGKAIGRYFNDPLSATGLALEPGGRLELVRSSGATLYYQRQWAPDWMTVAGASALWIGDEGLRPAESLKRAVYGSVNLIHRLGPRAIVGGELLWGEATRVSGASAGNARLQVSFRYLVF